MKKLYRLPNKAAISGVLAGLSEYLKLDVVVIRLAFIIGLILTGFFPLVVIYLVAHLLLPVRTGDSKDDDNVVDGEVVE